MKQRHAMGVLWTVLGLVAGFLFFLTLVPPVSRDALVHHLAVAKLYARAGAMVELPAMPWSYYPMNMTLAYWAALEWGNDILPKWIHLGLGLGTAGLIARYLAKELGRVWGLGGALVFLTLPVVMKLSTTAYVDLGLAFFSLAATLALLRAWDRGFSRWRDTAWVGLFCGLALGIKYNGLILAALLFFLIPLALVRHPDSNSRLNRRALGHALVFLMTLALAYAPTGVRNAAWTGNPVYPLYDAPIQSLVSALGGPTRPRAGVGETAVLPGRGISVRRDLHGESGLDIALLPLRIFLQGRDGDPQYFDGRLSPVLLLFLPLIVFWPTLPRAWKPHVAVLLAIAWGYIFLALGTAEVRVRYLMPVVPHLSLLSVFGAAFLWKRWTGKIPDRVEATVGEAREKDSPSRRLGRRWGRIGAALALGTFALSGIWISSGYGLSLYQYVDPMAYLSGELDRDAYVARFRREHPAHVWLNENLDGGDRVYSILLGRRGYYLDVPYVPDARGTHLRDLLYRGRAPMDSDAALDRLRTLGITHLVIDLGPTRLWLSSRPKDDGLRLAGFFRDHTRLVFSKNRVHVYALEPGSSPSVQSKN
ncbi:MAG: glycosyltransferase family 39 protein [Desulfobacterales bacterium]|nr:glycosyltransferase family 39 protein [Desulfobacterales bacterium]